MNKLVLLVVAALLVAAVSGARNKKNKADLKEWTFVVWMNGDNNLCSYTKANLEQIKAVNSYAYANVIVVFDCSENGDSRIFEWTPQGENVLESNIEYDMGDYEFLIKKVSWIFEKYPAKHRFLDLWNHGDGIIENGASSTAILRGVSWDDLSGSHITIPELGLATKALSAKAHIDVVGFDACYMGMIEIGYELREDADYLVASENTEPARGWDYTPIMKALKSGCPIEAGKATVDGYMAYNTSRTQLSLVDLKKLEPLAKALGQLDDISAFGSAYSFGGSFKDIHHALVLGEHQDLLPLLDAAVIYNKGTIPLGYGLSIYYTSSTPYSYYSKLKFAQDTNWLNH